LPDLTGRRLPVMIAIGRHRERLSSFNDRGAWLREVGRGRVVGRPAAGIASECRRLNLAPLPAGGDRGAEFARARAPDSALAGGFPGSRATAGGTRRRCWQVVIETPSLPELPGRRLPVMIAIGRHRQRLSSFTDRGAWLHGVARGRVVGGALAGGFPGSRATAGGTWRRYRQVAIETPGLPDLTGRRLPAMIVIGRPRQRLTSFNDRGAWLHGLPVVPRLAVLWPAGCRDRERVPAAESGAAADQGRSGRPGLPV